MTVHSSDPRAPGSGVSDVSPAEIDPTRPAGVNLPTRKILLGEELPIFCEKCGYALHGLPQQVCRHCAIRQFHCPECGHHQPINTLRPAAQKMLGRIRSFFLSISVLFKLNFFGWLLVAWVGMGHAWSYQYRYEQTYSMRPGGMARPGRIVQRYTPERYGPREVDMGQMMAFSMFGLAFGMLGRMLLLRWRRGYLVGLTLSTLVCLAVILGAMIRKIERETEVPLPHPFTVEFIVCIATGAVALTLGASIVWGIWTALAHVFLPKRTSQALLDWQRSQSNRAAAQMARD